MEYNVCFSWDAESRVWIATSEEVPGLILESGSIDALIERVKYTIPELLELNQQASAKSIRFQMNRSVQIYA